MSELNRAIARQLVASLEFSASFRETSEAANDFLEKGEWLCEASLVEISTKPFKWPRVFVEGWSY